MKLYYFADGCSLATHISLREAGIDVQLARVDIETREIAGSSERYAAINPKGYVPALVFDDGTMLTENVALLDWTAQQADALKPRDEMERTRLIEMLAFISTEIHKQFIVLFFAPGDESKPYLRKNIADRFNHIAALLKQDYLLGERFSTADAFVYVMLRWARMVQLEVPAALAAYMQRIEKRPAVRMALAAEGIEPRALADAA